jgi:hypothetical protein
MHTESITKIQLSVHLQRYFTFSHCVYIFHAMYFLD